MDWFAGRGEFRCSHLNKKVGNYSVYCSFKDGNSKLILNDQQMQQKMARKAKCRRKKIVDHTYLVAILGVDGTDDVGKTTVRLLQRSV